MIETRDRHPVVGHGPFEMNEHAFVDCLARAVLDEAIDVVNAISSIARYTGQRPDISARLLADAVVVQNDVSIAEARPSFPRPFLDFSELRNGPWRRLLDRFPAVHHRD